MRRCWAPPFWNGRCARCWRSRGCTPWWSRWRRMMRTGRESRRSWRRPRFKPRTAASIGRTRWPMAWSSWTAKPPRMIGFWCTMRRAPACRPRISPPCSTPSPRAAMAATQAAAMPAPCSRRPSSTPSNANWAITWRPWIAQGLWRALTPQVFAFAQLRHALKEAALAGITVTDEAQAVERLGLRPILVQGSPFNVKVTRAEDLAVAAQNTENDGGEADASRTRFRRARLRRRRSRHPGRRAHRASQGRGGALRRRCGHSRAVRRRAGRAGRRRHRPAFPRQRSAISRRGQPRVPARGGGAHAGRRTEIDQCGHHGARRSAAHRRASRRDGGQSRRRSRRRGAAHQHQGHHHGAPGVHRPRRRTGGARLRAAWGPET